jgi:hypothetical protein
MIELLAGGLFGVAAHQTDRIVKHWPAKWELLGRYVIGGLTVILSFALILSKLNRAALKDGMLSVCGAFGSVGVGVAFAMLFDEVIK